MGCLNRHPIASFLKGIAVSDVLLKAEKITKEFPGVKALDDVDFELRRGELHCLVGENGAGKTTFIKVLYGAYTDYRGDVYLNGEHVRITHPLQAQELGIAAIQQHRDLVPTLSGAENIFLGMELKRGIFVDEGAQYELARKVVARFDETINLEIPVQYLTVAEQEIIAIAKALLREHQILILDEATAPLDRNERQILFEVLKDMKSGGDIGIIFISHHINELFEIGDRVTVFKDGKLVATRGIKDVDVNEVIRLMIGEEERKRYQKQKVERGIELLSMKNVTVPDLIRNVNLSVRKGEIVGVAGRLGANKHIIAEVIFGLKNKTQGEIVFNGEQLSVSRPEDAIRKGIGLLPIDRRDEGLILCRGVSENVILTWLNKVKKGFLSILSLNNRTKEYVDKLGIKTTSLSQRVEYLSGGNQQKVVMSKWLNANSDLLILLEPTEGIDVQTRWDIYSILEELARSGKGILLISSDLDEVVSVSDRVYVMRDGEIVDEVSGKNIEYRYIFEKSLSGGNHEKKRSEA
jgi:ABC-type sugar transport system ATPase subunit